MLTILVRPFSFLSISDKYIFTPPFLFMASPISPFEMDVRFPQQVFLFSSSLLFHDPGRGKLSCADKVSINPEHTKIKLRAITPRRYPNSSIISCEMSDLSLITRETLISANPARFAISRIIGIELAHQKQATCS
jgi:hypothetical protein